MIHWLVETDSAHPSLARGVPPGGLLNAAERDRFASLRSEKRRRDWLLGRWTAKRLLCTTLVAAGDTLPADAIEVASDPDGAPTVRVDAGRLVARDDTRPHSPIRESALSISHSRDRALCAVTQEDGVSLGADIEYIEPRAAGFAAAYFTPEEAALVERASDGERDTLVTAIWSAKEAVLKALRLGLVVDTRAIVCRPCAPVDGGWAPVSVEFDAVLLGREAPTDAAGWWRVVDGFVLTLAALGARIEP